MRENLRLLSGTDKNLPLAGLLLCKCLRMYIYIEKRKIFVVPARVPSEKVVGGTAGDEGIIDLFDIL